MAAAQKKLTKEQRVYILNEVLRTLAVRFADPTEEATQKIVARKKAAIEKALARTKKRLAKAPISTEDFNLVDCGRAIQPVAKSIALSKTERDAIQQAERTAQREIEQLAEKYKRYRLPFYSVRTTGGWSNSVQIFLPTGERDLETEIRERLHKLEGELLFAGEGGIEALLDKALSSFKDILK